MRKPTNSPKLTALAGDHPWRTTNQGTPHPTRQTTEPIDRSIPLVIMTNATPRLRMPYKPVRSNCFDWLYPPRNLSLRIAVTTYTTTKVIKIPLMFFILSIQANSHSSNSAPLPIP